MLSGSNFHFGGKFYAHTQNCPMHRLENQVTKIFVVSTFVITIWGGEKSWGRIIWLYSLAVNEWPAAHILGLSNV